MGVEWGRGCRHPARTGDSQGHLGGRCWPAEGRTEGFRAEGQQGPARAWSPSEASGTKKGADREEEGRLTLCLQPESLNGHSTRAVLQLSFRWPGRSSRATVPTPHWLGQGTGNLGHWYWWLYGHRGRETGGQQADPTPPRRLPHSPQLWEGLTWMVSKTNSLAQ